MFGFFFRKKVDLKKVIDYKHAIKTIKVFSILEDWNKAYASIKEIRAKEEADYKHLFDEIEKVSGVIADSEKIKLSNEYKERLNELKILEDRVKLKEQEVLKKTEEKRFKIRLKNAENDFYILLKTNKNQEAMSLITNFLELNKENPKSITFYNKKKSILLKNIEKSNYAQENKLKQNIKLEAFKLIGEKVDTTQNEEVKKEKGFFESISLWFKENFNLLEKLRIKKLVDDVNILIEEDSIQKTQLASEKLERIHKGLVKELTVKESIGYDFYGKILGTDKISGDTFGFNDSEEKNKYNFFIGDATGHGVRAGFIVTLFSIAFRKHSNKDIKEMVYNINNDLKQDLKNRNFITGVLFEIQKDNISKLNFVGMGHEPVFIYRAKTMEVEIIIAGGLAGGIRIIRNAGDVKVKNVNLEDGDILMVYSDGATELRNEQGETLGVDKLKEIFLKIASLEKNLKNMYEYIVNSLKSFKLGTNFKDDLTILLVRRDKNKDIVKKDDTFITDMGLQKGLSKKEIDNFVGKTRKEINEEIEKIKHSKEIKSEILLLESLYYTGEILKLKQEAIRCIKKGLIDKEINYYLKKAINNETKYKISQKEQKAENKYNVLNEIFKKGDYSTVIKECENIIIKDGNI